MGDLAGFPFRGLLNEELFCEYSGGCGCGWRTWLESCGLCMGLQRFISHQMRFQQNGDVSSHE